MTEDREAEIEDALYQAAVSGNVAAIAAYLARRPPAVSIEERIGLLLDGPPKLTAREALAMIRERLAAPELNDHPGIAARERAKVDAILEEVERLI